MCSNEEMKGIFEQLPSLVNSQAIYRREELEFYTSFERMTDSGLRRILLMAASHPLAEEI